MINGIQVFDCFKFFTEKELLHLRFMEYYDIVDYFVIVEATTTQTSLPHTPIFESLKPKFEKYLDKVIHIVVDDMPTYSKENIWIAENFQRNCIERGLKGIAKKGDAIFVSDCDEFWNRDKINECVGKDYPVVFVHELYHFWMNAKRSYKWRGTCYAPYGLMTPQEMRDYSKNVFNESLVKRGFISGEAYLIMNGGWHFSALGNAQNMQIRTNSLCEGDPEKKIDCKNTKKIFNNLGNYPGQIGIMVGIINMKRPFTINEFKKDYKYLFFNNYIIILLSYLRKLNYKIKTFFDIKMMRENKKLWINRLLDKEIY